MSTVQFDEKGYIGVANAVVIQACNDYVNAHKTIALNRKKLNSDKYTERTKTSYKRDISNAEMNLKSSKIFFDSQEFQLYTSVDKDCILKELDRQVEKELKRISKL